MVKHHKKMKGKGFMDFINKAVDVGKKVFDVGKAVRDSGAIGHALNAGTHLAKHLGHDNIAAKLGTAHGYAKKAGAGRKRKLKGKGPFGDLGASMGLPAFMNPASWIGMGRKRKLKGSGPFGDLGKSMGLPAMMNPASWIGMGRGAEREPMQGGMKMPWDDMLKTTQQGMSTMSDFANNAPQLLKLLPMFGLGKKRHYGKGGEDLFGNGLNLAGGSLNLAGGGAEQFNYSLPVSTPMYNRHLSNVNTSAVKRKAPQEGGSIGLGHRVRRGIGHMHIL